MDINYLHRELVTTEDGSYSLKLSDVEEQYHSIHGARNESIHIYINAGLKYWSDKAEVHILEAGFGTGLNALLTLQQKSSQVIHYETIEAFPLSMEEVVMLNYISNMDEESKRKYYAMHACMADKIIRMNEHFYFRKRIDDIRKVALPESQYDLVYFDMFSPDIQPDLWSESVFQKVYRSLKNSGILVTYCAKGDVKRALKAVGFELESLPGPQGKREITRAIKR